MIYLDTHVVAWLFAGMVERLGAEARRVVRWGAPIISPMVVLELDYLHEIGKTGAPGQSVLADLRERIGLRMCERPFADVISLASAQKWTRDPLDRIIVSQAAIGSDPLLTRDRSILKHYPHAVW